MKMERREGRRRWRDDNRCVRDNERMLGGGRRGRLGGEIVLVAERERDRERSGLSGQVSR